MQKEFSAIEDAFSKKMFSKSEIEGYALWKSATYYGENFHYSPKLGQKTFEAILLKLTGYYLALATGA
ncbi:MAG: hypothetical protein NE328_13095 [Lentisphaeraceae bacterium]|nr:hypothetical protein [Lentisphaeraceae bacterium]